MLWRCTRPFVQPGVHSCCAAYIQKNVLPVIIFLLHFICDVQLVLRSGVPTVLDLEVDVVPSFAEVFNRSLEIGT